MRWFTCVSDMIEVGGRESGDTAAKLQEQAARIGQGLSGDVQSSKTRVPDNSCYGRTDYDVKGTTM